MWNGLPENKLSKSWLAPTQLCTNRFSDQTNQLATSLAPGFSSRQDSKQSSEQYITRLLVPWMKTVNPFASTTFQSRLRLYESAFKLIKSIPLVSAVLQRWAGLKHQESKRSILHCIKTQKRRVMLGNLLLMLPTYYLAGTYLSTCKIQMKKVYKCNTLRFKTRKG